MGPGFWAKENLEENQNRVFIDYLPKVSEVKFGKHQLQVKWKDQLWPVAVGKPRHTTVRGEIVTDAFLS